MKQFNQMKAKDPERLALQHTFHSTYAATAHKLHDTYAELDANVTQVAVADRASLHFFMETSAVYVVFYRCRQPMPLWTAKPQTDSDGTATADALCASYIVQSKPLLWGSAAELLRDYGWDRMGIRSLPGPMPANMASTTNSSDANQRDAEAAAAIAASSTATAADKASSSPSSLWWCPRRTLQPQSFAIAAGANPSTLWQAPDPMSCRAVLPSAKRNIVLTVFPRVASAAAWASLSRFIASLRATGCTADVVVLFPVTAKVFPTMEEFVHNKPGVTAEEYNDDWAVKQMNTNGDAHVFAVLAGLLARLSSRYSASLTVPLDTAFQLNPFAAVTVKPGHVLVAQSSPMVRHVFNNWFERKKTNER